MKLKQQKAPKFSTRAYTRCKICGRPHSVLKKYGICRVCFRELAYKGVIPIISGLYLKKYRIYFKKIRRTGLQLGEKWL